MSIFLLLTLVPCKTSLMIYRRHTLCYINNSGLTVCLMLFVKAVGMSNVVEQTGLDVLGVIQRSSHCLFDVLDSITRWLVFNVRILQFQFSTNIFWSYCICVCTAQIYCTASSFQTNCQALMWLDSYENQYRANMAYPVLLEDIINSSIGTLNEKAVMAGDKNFFMSLNEAELNSNVLYYCACR